MRGRPPTPPLSTPAPDGIPDLFGEANASFVGNTTSSSLLQTETSSRNSPDLLSTEIQGQYVDPTSGFSFLERARNRVLACRIPLENVQDHDRTMLQQPLMTAGDKPLMLRAPEDATPAHALLPKGDDAVELLDLYFDVCVATYKPLHRPTLDVWHKTALQNIEQGRSLPHGIGHARVSTLFAVFAVAIYHRQKTQTSVTTQSDTVFHESLTYTSNETGQPRLESAQARLVQVFYLLMTCRMNQAWFTFGTVLQIASSLGLHRRERRPARSKDYIHQECQKRTFWTTYILDKYLGVVLGRPQHYHDDDIDQDLPDCVNDDDMATDGYKINEDHDDCVIEAFVLNASLARLVGKTSRQLYPTRPLSATERLEKTQKLQRELDEWHTSLPPFLSTVKPSSLIRSLQRQSVALKMAHCHAVMHLHRPYLLRSSGCHAEVSVKHCVTAAVTVLRAVDHMATSSPMFHAFWWTHYVTFCALSIAYVWQIQSPRVDCGVNMDQLLALAGRCQAHLARATATNSPSRRYSIILEELRSEAGVRQDVEVGAAASTFMAGLTAAATDGPENSIVENNLFDGWQVSDWLDLDALVNRSHVVRPNRH